MKTSIICLSTALYLAASNVTLAQVRYVAVTTVTTTNANYAVLPTDMVVMTASGNNGGSFVANGFCSNGFVKLSPSSIYTGLTNVQVVANANVFQYATFQITPCVPPVTIVSNYVPAQCIVIPAAQTGSVMVTLQSSPDLVNWVNSEPGLYSAAISTNRFFRVSAIVQP